jgi:hypothetical protein
LYLPRRAERAYPPGRFIAPCLPTKAHDPPSGKAWLHEIKHDGFWVIARKDGARVRLYSRPGNDLAYRFPLIVETMARLRPRSCIIDGEAVVCDGDGMVSFDHIRYRRHDSAAFQDEEPGSCGSEARGREGVGATNQRKPRPWMRREQVFIWTASIVMFLVVAVALTYRAMS